MVDNNRQVVVIRDYIDEKIRNLLVSTQLTFKQIIETLKKENITVTSNTIRRVNKDYRYRKPRCEPKLSSQMKLVLLSNLMRKKKAPADSMKRVVCHDTDTNWCDRKGDESKRTYRENFEKLINKQQREAEKLDDDPIRAAQSTASNMVYGDDMMMIDNQMRHSHQNQSDVITRFQGFNLMANDDLKDPLDLDQEQPAERSNYFANNFTEPNFTTTTSDSHYANLTSNESMKVLGNVISKMQDGYFRELPIVMYTRSGTSGSSSRMMSPAMSMTNNNESINNDYSDDQNWMTDHKSSLSSPSSSPLSISGSLQLLSEEPMNLSQSKNIKEEKQV